MLKTSHEKMKEKDESAELTRKTMVNGKSEKESRVLKWI